MSNRQGIPKQELGECVRCNLQIEGSGPKPTDVIMDGGTKYEGNPDKEPSAKPKGWAKHVVLRVDRGDGFVGRNFTTRGGLEFGFYTEETDGILLEKTKFYWAQDYGHLSFTTDHHEIRDCDSFGAGDAAIYPGASPETGSQATKFYPDAPRANTTVRRCDMRGSALGYSGSMGNAVRITDNHIYGNGGGIASDTLSSAGHPGFPADSSQIDNNYIYSNNLNLFRDDAPVRPLVTTPVGTGILYAGMNDAKVHDNWIFDNWRDGVMLLAVPGRAGQGRRRRGRRLPGRLVPRRTGQQAVHLLRQPLLQQQDGPEAARFQVPARGRPVQRLHGAQPQLAGLDAQRQRLLVGRVLRQHEELLVRQHRPGRQGGQRDRPRRGGPDSRAAAGAAAHLQRRVQPGLEHRRRATSPRPSTWSSARTARTRTPARWTATGGPRRAKPRSAAASRRHSQYATAATAFARSPEGQRLEKRIDALKE